MVKNDLIKTEFPTEKERVIFLWSVPANGHLNPTLCFTDQLLKSLDLMKVEKLVFYSGKEFRDQVINVPNNINQNRIEFRDYSLDKYHGSENLLKLLMNFDTKPGSLFRFFQCFENSIKLGNQHMFKQLLQDIYRDKPMLILYDQALFFPKMALRLYEKRYKCPKPLHAAYVTTFLCAQGIYPYWSELSNMGLLGKTTKYQQIKNVSLSLYDFVRYVYTYYKTLWWENDFSLFDLIFKCDLPMGRNHLIDDNLNLVFVLPEIQPRLEEFQASNIKFVGPAVDEFVRSKLSNRKSDMNEYVTIIEKFLQKNTVQSITNRKNLNYFDSHENKLRENLMRSDSDGENFKRVYKPIIYVSMGTVFNNENKDLFHIIVEACQSFADEYSIIVSTGDLKTYERYKTANSDKILFVPHTPQIEILKRASLFITHAGMNSASEAIQYGVPIICLPLSGDQPFVAWRVADELGIGIRLQPDKDLTIEKVKISISKVLTDPSYRTKAYDLSLISKQYSGHKKAVEHVVDFLAQNEMLSQNSSSLYSSTSSFLQKH